MPLSAGEIRRIHAHFGDAHAVVSLRRAVYSAIAELAVSVVPAISGRPEVLDNPAVRNQLAAVLHDPAAPVPDCCQPVGALVAPGFSAKVDGDPVRLASAPAVSTMLAGAVRRVSDELRGHDDRSALSLLTVEDGPRIRAAWRLIVDGVQLASTVAPDLARDLLPHVALFAVLGRDSSGRLGSASAREFPGLILLPEPRTAIEVAEALVHEGAHQKFFDLAVTRDLTGLLDAPVPTFRPGWAPGGAPSWSLEQTVAAWHAYTCLAAFRGALNPRIVLHPGSLLPLAAARAREIEDWLLAHGRLLGADGHHLLRELSGREPDGPCAVNASVAPSRVGARGATMTVRHCGARALVGVQAVPLELYWVSSDELTALDAGGQRAYSADGRLA